MTTTLDDLWIVPDDSLVPPIDRDDFVPSSPLQQQWYDNGYVILEKFLPDNLIDAYCDSYPEGGWGIGTPYMLSPELRALSTYQPLADRMEHIIGEPMGLHLNLTYWRSTERDWHQDDYLNPPFVYGWYAAVWMALADIHPDSGPFEFIPRSHKWPLIRQDLMLQAMGEDGSDPDWPWRSEKILRPLVDAKAAAEGLETEKFIANRGDVLIWSSRLMHRGSKANAPGMIRKGLISHYSGITHRMDMPEPIRDPGGSHYFPLGNVKYGQTN